MENIFTIENPEGYKYKFLLSELEAWIENWGKTSNEDIPFYRFIIYCEITRTIECKTKCKLESFYAGVIASLIADSKDLEMAKGIFHDTKAELSLLPKDKTLEELEGVMCKLFYDFISLDKGNNSGQNSYLELVK